MSMFIEYATVDDVIVGYMGKKSEEAPEGIEILVKRANELIHIAMRNNYKSDNPEHIESAKLAVCAQCQNWIETELSPVSDNNIQSYNLGELSITYSDVDKCSSKLCTSALRYLNHKHLLYKGMG